MIFTERASLAIHKPIPWKESHFHVTRISLTTTHIQYNTGRCLISYNDSRANQRITAYFLYTIKDPFIATRQSSFRKSFHTLLFVFRWTTFKHPRARLKKRLHFRPAISHPSLVHSLRSVQHIETVRIPKQFSHSSLCFLVDQVLESQIKTEEETSWMKLTPLLVSS